MVSLRMKNIHFQVFWIVSVISTCSLQLRYSSGATDLQDVYAINSLYSALGFPPLPGWVVVGGDPCGENWQGVLCVGPNMTAIVLNATDLGGQLSDALGNFTTLITMDLSNNHITGSIPENLPPHLQRLFLSGNQFTGSIPSTLGDLGLLTDMSLNNNHLTGSIPDVFQTLVGLINMDLSFNNLSGLLPASFSNLSALTTLHLQDNQLSGMLNVLEELNLQDLNIENNLFSGPVPPQMVNKIASFRRGGNPFNVTPMASPPSQPPSFSQPPTSPVNSASQPQGPSQAISANITGRTFFTTPKIIGMFFTVLMAIAIVILGMCMCTSWFKDKQARASSIERNDVVAYGEPIKKLRKDATFIPPSPEIVTVSIEDLTTRKLDHKTDIGKVDVHLEESSVDTMMSHALEVVKAEKTLDPEKKNCHVVLNAYTEPGHKESMKPNPQKLPHIVPNVTPYTISELQKFTNSFGELSLIGEGSLGHVYLAELPDGKLAVKKLDASNPMLHTDESFLKLVTSISLLQHANITKLIGYSVEHGQRILLYEFYCHGTLHDALHSRDINSEPLLWSSRMKLALDAARALEYLHEICEPPVVHHKFTSANIFLDAGFSACVSDCGMTSLFSSSCASKVLSHVAGSFSYGSPEYTMYGVYNVHSDIYSFGVVMLELLTGRIPLDRSLPRKEQSLVRWAVPRLHDIDALTRMVDPALKGSFSVKSLSRFADIISLCLQPEPEFRPPMSQIVQALSRLVQMESESVPRR